MMKGIDISSWQRGIDLAALKTDFVICKLSEGCTWADPCFDGFYDAALAAALPVGAYVYSRAASSDRSKAEAEKALSLLAGRKLPLGLYLDVEDRAQLALPRAALADVIRVFCSTVRAAGYTAGVYGSAGQLWAKVKPAELGEPLVWVASWGAKPRMDCDLWQYSDRERLPGFDGRLDGDESVSARFGDLIRGGGTQDAPAQDASGSFTLTGVPLLRAGGAGDAVKALQGELIAFGYRCGGRIVGGAEIPDGIFGTQTRASVAAFQRAHGLAGDGVAGRDTRAALLGIKG